MSLDFDRLAKVLGMVGSAHEGEALNALRQADMMLRSAGLTWLGLTGAVQEIGRLEAEVERLKAELRSFTDDDTWQPPHVAIARRLKDDIRLDLSDWERDFLNSIAERFEPLTLKQKCVFDRIRRKAKS